MQPTQFPALTIGLSFWIKGEVAKVGVVVRILAELTDGEHDLLDARQYAFRRNRGCARRSGCQKTKEDESGETQ